MAYKILKRILFLVLPSIIITLSCAELGFRHWFRDKPVSPMWGFANANWENRYVKLNSKGFREGEISVARSSGTTRIVAIGDSHTFGVGINRVEDRYTEILEKELNKRMRPRSEVINLGICGADTVDELITLKEIGIPLDPDLVILQFFYDDLRNGFDKELLSRTANIPAWDRYIVKKSYLAGYLNAFFIADDVSRKALEYFNNLSAPGAPNLPGFKKAIGDFANMCRENGIDVAAVVFPICYGIDMDNYPFSRTDEFIRENLESLKIPYVNVLPLLKGYKGKELWVSTFDPHPNEEVHRIAGDALVELVEPLLKNK